MHAKSVVCGPFGSNILNDNYVEHGIPMVRPFNLRNFQTDQGDVAYLDENFASDAGLKIFPSGTVMFARVGDIGAGVSFSEKATISPNIIAAELKDSINPLFVGVFANSIYGHMQLESGMKVVAQPTISTESIRSFRIPQQSRSFQDSIGGVFSQAIRTQTKAVLALQKAEATLLQALNLSNWQAPEPLSYTRSSSDAFAAGRLDAEYFHPAKTAALAALQAQSHFTVGDLFDSVRELWQPDDWNPGTTVRNYDLSDALSPFLDASKQPTDVELIASTKKVIQAGDLVVSRLRSYLKEIAVVLPSDNMRMVASSEFIVLRPRAESFPTEVLMVYLRSVLPQVVFKWSQDGSNHPRFNEKELLALPVPHIEEGTQETIKAAVLASRQAKQRATQLLDAVKRAVEIAIEESEDAALAHLQLVAKD